MPDDDAPPPDAGRSRHNISVAEVQSEVLLKGLALWEGQRGTRRFPARADMPPRLLGALLRNTVLVRVLGAAEDFEFRVVGDAIVAIQGASFQGMTTSRIEVALPGYGRMLKGVYRGVCESRAPAAYRGWFERGADARAFFHESLVLPLGQDGETVDHLLVFGVYAYGDKQAVR
jgi:hypothetical protein